MRPIRLEFCGVNSFSEPAVIDFSALLEFGIFGIFGDTGAGKSTILDCIGFALYGNVGRSRSGSIADVINYKTDKASVIFEFEITFEGGRRHYRVERELKRKNATQSVRVYEYIDGAYVTASDSVRESNALLERIVGLEQKDFEKCIALPQGEFAQFVKSARSDRLKLVSRLFDLEQYGEGLVKRVNARHADARREREVLEAGIAPYAEITAEGIAHLKEEIAALERADSEARALFSKLREEEKILSALREKKGEAERVAAEMKKLEVVREEMKALSGELSRLVLAAAVDMAVREQKTAEERAITAKKALEGAETRLKKAENTLSELSSWKTEEADAEIVRLTEERARALAAEDLNKRKRELETQLLANKNEEKKLSASLVDPDYAKERAAIDERLQELGGDDFLALLGERGRSALMRGEYATFADELRTLEYKHPEITDDTAPLIARYSALASGENLDFNALKQVFEAREGARKAAQEALLDLEKAKHNFDLKSQKLLQLHTEAERLNAEIANCTTQLEGAPKLAVVDTALERKRAERKERTEALARANEELVNARLALASAKEKSESAKELSILAQSRLSGALTAGGFTSAQEAETLSKKYGNPEEARERVEKYKEKYAATRARMRDLNEIDFSSVSDEAWAVFSVRFQEAEENGRQTARTLALKRDELSRGERDLERKRTLEKGLAEAKRKAELLERLKKLLEGNKFMEFVAEEYLQTVAENASGRLLTLTDGRYFLRYDGGFFVGDNFNGGALRGVYTLSGGETFLVSLSLALALSAEICARSLRPIEFFFLDEGFGTLDERLVDTVMDSLEKLKGEHFSIGIISHVEELKHRIGRKLTVKKATEKRGSQILSE